MNRKELDYDNGIRDRPSFIIRYRHIQIAVTILSIWSFLLITISYMDTTSIQTRARAINACENIRTRHEICQLNSNGTVTPKRIDNE